MWTQGAPLSDKIVTTQYVIELVPHVKGRVTAVDAQPHQPLKKGDLLLEIDPTEYQYKVAQLEAQLKAAQATVWQAVAGVQAANAAVDSAQATAAKAEGGGRTGQDARTDGPGHSTRAPGGDQRAQGHRGDAQAARVPTPPSNTPRPASPRRRPPRFRPSVAVEVARSNVPAIEAQLNDARFDLAQCRMTAPDDGYVVNWQVQVGTMLTPGPAAAGTFVKTSDIAVIAVYPQNSLANVRPGDDVEMVLNPYPGAIFRGKVAYVISATGGGQMTASGTVPNAADIGSTGLSVVRIDFSDEAAARHAVDRRRRIGGHLHARGQADAHDLEGRNPDEEVAVVCPAIGVTAFATLSRSYSDPNRVGWCRTR